MKYFTDEEWSRRMSRFGSYIPMDQRGARDAFGRRWTNRERHPALDDVILDNLSTRGEIASRELYRVIVADYGGLCLRVFYRHLAELRMTGKIIVTRTEYYGAREKLFYRKPKAVSPSK